MPSPEIAGRLRKAACFYLSAVLVLGLAPLPALVPDAALAQGLAAGSVAPAAAGATDQSASQASYRASVDSFGDASVPQGVHVRRAGAHGLKVSWRPVAGARGYVVYRWDEAKWKWRRAEVLPAKARSWRDKGLAPDKVCRYAVAACKGKGGKKPGKMSYWVEAMPYSKGAKRVNPGRVSAPALTELEIGQVSGRGVGVAPSSFGKKIGKRGCRAFSRNVRVVSSNPSIVLSNDEGGSLEARSKGECDVRYIARNGNVSAPMRVKVTGHRPPGEFKDPGDTDPPIYDTDLIDYLNARSVELYQVTERLYASGCDHGYWGASRSSDGKLSFPSWMSANDRAAVGALFEDECFDDTFRLTDISYNGESYHFVFYSAILESVLDFDDSYDVFTQYPDPYEDDAVMIAGAPLADGWYLGLPNDSLVSY